MLARARAIAIVIAIFWCGFNEPRRMQRMSFYETNTNQPIASSPAPSISTLTKNISPLVFLIPSSG